ncbi:ACT domain-containing protein [Candidatus Bathyarchaeota archaeon]|nr:ACT domain-containing protein [Candidatus Bathyarchaeota archaeon]
MIPFQVQRLLYRQGRRLYGIIVEAFSKPGVLASISSMLAERNLDVIYCTAITAEDKRGGIIFLVDFTDSDAMPQSVAEELKALDFVEDVTIIEPVVDGFLIDDATFPIMLGRRRALILDDGMLRGIFISFRERLGSGGEAMLYHLGLEAGRSRGRHAAMLAQKVGIKSLDRGLETVAKALKALGYGIIEFIELQENPPRARVRIYNSIECELGRGAGHPFSQYIRGLITGIASEFFRREMTAREVKCIAMGDPYCEFELKPQM